MLVSWMKEFFESFGFDQYYLEWVFKLCYPILIFFFLPFTILFLLYFCALLIQIFRFRGYLLNHNISTTRQLVFRIVSAIWSAHGALWHGYEVRGFENIPTKGGALLIYFHGVIPIDLYYLVSHIYGKINRNVFCVGDNVLFKVPGLKRLLKELNVMPGTVVQCVEILGKDKLLAISPGGVREALFSSDNYELLWGQRRGYAKVAKEANVPVIPVFTRNCREAFRTISFFRNFLRKLYEKTRLPLVPIYGGFPVKLVTYIGKPIHFSSTQTTDEIADQIKNNLKELIIKNQIIPGKIMRAITERIIF